MMDMIRGDTLESLINPKFTISVFQNEFFLII